MKSLPGFYDYKQDSPPNMKRMISLRYLLIAIFVFQYSYSQVSTKNVALANVIKKYENHKAYSYEEYPLGRYDETLYKEEAQFAKELIDDLKFVDKNSLTHTEKISLDLLHFILQDKIDHYEFKMYLNPIQADQGFHLNLNYQVRPIRNYNDGISYLKRLKAIPYFTDSQLNLIRKGIKERIVQPKVIFKGYENSYNTHIVDNPEESYFYSPFKRLPNSISKKQKDSLQIAAQGVIKESVVPSFHKIKDFIEKEYFPNTRKELGISSIPNGKDFYQNRINYYTTSTNYTPESIHALGLKEVERIRSEMNDIIKGIGFKGDFEEFLNFLRTDPQFYAKESKELLMFARDICKRIDAKLPAYFNKLPRQPYGVKAVPAAMAPKYTTGRYSPSNIKGTEPGYFLVNTYKLESRPLYALPALATHEAVPGHHLQMALNSELSDSIPDFRKRLYLSVYGEGWALYTEHLANEMGIYTTPYEKFGQLTYEMWRACRLVVDTGIHAMGWTRDEAIAFMSKNTALSIHEINTETDRYIGWPGQALSYKIGELKIKELRNKAEKALGSKFDIRKFHEVILEQGTVTLPILEAQMNDYIDSSSPMNK